MDTRQQLNELFGRSRSEGLHVTDGKTVIFLVHEEDDEAEDMGTLYMAVPFMKKDYIIIGKPVNMKTGKPIGKAVSWVLAIGTSSRNISVFINSKIMISLLHEYRQTDDLHKGDAVDSESEVSIIKHKTIYKDKVVPAQIKVTLAGKSSLISKKEFTFEGILAQGELYMKHESGVYLSNYKSMFDKKLLQKQPWDKQNKNKAKKVAKVNTKKSGLFKRKFSKHVK